METLKTPSIFILFLNGINAKSQVLLSLIFGDKLNSDVLEFGLEGGTHFSNISNIEKDKALTVFSLGFYFDIRLKTNGTFLLGFLSNQS